MLVPSTLNCTPATDTLSAALAVTETVPVCVPPVGDEIDTVGGVVSGAVTVTVVLAVTVPWLLVAVRV